MSNEKRANFMVPILYVAKFLDKDPVKVINFILKNKQYFPELTQELLLKIMEEKHVTREDLDTDISILRRERFT